MPRRAALLPPVAGSLLCCRSVARRAPCARVVIQSPSAFCEAFLCPRPIGQHLSGYSGEKSGPEQTPNLRSSCHLHPLLSVGSAIFYFYYYILPTTYYIPSLPFLGSTFSSAASESQLYCYRDYEHTKYCAKKIFFWEKLTTKQRKAGKQLHSSSIFGYLGVAAVKW